MFGEFVKKIQNSSQSEKKNWLIALSSLTMIIIVAVWIVMLNYKVTGNKDSSEITEETSFWQIMENGINITARQSLKLFQNIGQNIESNLKDKIIILETKLFQKRTITIE